MYVIATLSVYPHRASLKNIPPWPGIFFKLARCGYTLRVAITYNIKCLLKSDLIFADLLQVIETTDASFIKLYESQTITS